MSDRKNRLLHDLRRYVGQSEKPTLRLLVSTAFRQPGFAACWLYRVQEALYSSGRLRRAQAVYLANLWLTQADLVPGSTIGPGLMIRHANGIVVGVGASIGENCTLLQQVTLGAADIDTAITQGYPHVGNSVAIGAGAKIIGAVRIGDGATVGANAVVTRDVAPGATVAGVPARDISRPAS